MTLQNLYSLRIFLRLARLLFLFFVVVDGVIVIIGSANLEFNRDLLIYTLWTALWIVLTFPLTEALNNVSDKISNYESKE